MTAQNIIRALVHLLEAQQKLSELACDKTERLKRNEIQELDELLTKEEKYVKLLGEAEDKRVVAVEQFLDKKELVIEEVTLAALYPFVHAEERNELQTLQAKLTKEIHFMQEQNNLNKELTKRSLQYVNASLNMLAPEPTQATYKHPENKKQAGEQRSFFDSQA